MPGALNLSFKSLLSLRSLCPEPELVARLPDEEEEPFEEPEELLESDEVEDLEENKNLKNLRDERD